MTLRNLAKEVKLDYLGKTFDRSVEVKFKNKISKSKIYLSKKTGTLFHSPTKNTDSSVSVWSKNIFSNRIDTSKIQYTSNNPIMRSRHYYSAIFINNHIKKKKIKFCDYGAGEGNFAKELLRVNNKISFNFSEHSQRLFNLTKKIVKLNSKKKFYCHNGTIESTISNKKFSNFDCASLLWTLCNCVDPLSVLDVIHKSLKKNGLLLIAESSRILVPFKKPIYNFFVSKYETNNTHPWFFSYNSLSNLLEISGFRIVSSNRYYDENDLVVVAKKISKSSHKPKIKIDKYKKVLKFLMEWEKFSFKYK